MSQPPQLQKKLGAFHLWGIAVGLVISGEYFGWSYGWATAGTLGFLGATCLVALMYTAFIFSFTELTCAIPHAGGPFAYAQRALGRVGGTVTGLATLVEFIFAPPAIALAIGAYLNVQFPGLPPKLAATGAYLAFMTLNIVGVHVAATFELFITIAAIIELLVFMAVVAPSFSWAHFTHMGWGTAPHFGWEAMGGLFAAIPFAIWFFLAIEGVAMAAEEARNPKRSIPIAYCAGVLTLVALAFGVMIFAGGSGDWTTLASLNDPLPEAMKRVVGQHSPWLSMLVWLGLFGLIASLHGIIMGFARQIFALARANILPRSLGTLHHRFHTPHRATIAGSVIGILAIYADSIISIHGQSLTAVLVTLSVFGALTMYGASMISLFVLRRREPGLDRSYKAPLYPILPAIALAGAAISFVAVTYYNFILFLYYTTALIVITIYLTIRQRSDKGGKGSILLSE
ncbi:ethanolamine permease [Asaia siamensis]|uniref:Ethanolamine permease n=1 Tax=Asaia siamensis TaxID=110479 RepID=A0ABQ1MFB9_9PROT|nr:ethanolamine permease [Asaia siamensis]GBR06762.1 amino acid transporter [Asaia siamensis NRIC 0323]GGC39797.1 ethanolamine permease [Asaia siamensis]